MKKKLLSTFLSFCLCGGATLATDKPGTPPPATAAADENGARVAAAIGALGANPATKQISTIVFKAVRSSPDSVLPIVDAAVRVSPQAAAPEIVTAATSAVPNPWKQVTYRRITPAKAKGSAPDYKSGPDGKQADSREPGQAPGAALASDGVSKPSEDVIVITIAASRRLGPGAREDAPPPLPDNGTPMTLAEAIARTAFDALPGLSFAQLQAAVNAALLSDPATLMRKIQSPSAASGVGDAGTSNYSNEPLLTPKQPVVSR